MNQRSQPISKFPNKFKDTHNETQAKQKVFWDL